MINLLVETNVKRNLQFNRNSYKSLLHSKELQFNRRIKDLLKLDLHCRSNKNPQ